ncbi:6993_t:CDS:2 [Cetraspora pellucida]|uniref:6993_t:CDS:1 n=1 Tax=Cetraspora pellucida TaxID=1433469 RepID=A0ACA9LP37_9GLOM|nr:6993_t:CDS:2 [Cetraspora pellucida]
MLFYSSFESSINTNEMPSVINVENDNYQLSSENEDLINDFSSFKDNDETERIFSNANESDMNTINQLKSNILLKNYEIEEIVVKLPDESSYAPETAQAITTYLQVIDEPVATEEILDDEVIISIVQADENEESISQKINEEDKVPDPSVTPAKVFNAMQTVICYEKQKNSESNLPLEELEFL